MLRSFFGKYSLESGATFVLWMSLCCGVMTMLSPSNNVSFSTRNPPKEFWETMEKMQRNWLTAVERQRRMRIEWLKNFTRVSEQSPHLMPQNPEFFHEPSSESSTQSKWPYPEPGEIASEITFGVSWMNVPLGFIQVLVSGYGLYGIYEEHDPKYLFPYLAWSVIYTVITYIMGLFSPMGPMVMAYLMSLVQLGFYVYFLLVVYSFYIAKKAKRYHKDPITI